MIPTAIHYITVNWIPDTDVILQKAHNTPSAYAEGVLCERENERVYGIHLPLGKTNGGKWSAGTCKPLPGRNGSCRTT